jgi:hypothetical protein
MMSFDLRDARESLEETEWLTNVYPLYLHDLSEFGLHATLAKYALHHFDQSRHEDMSSGGVVAPF